MNIIANLSISAIGAAYGTAKAGIGIAGVGTFRPDLIMKVSSSSSAIFISYKLKVTCNRSLIKLPYFDTLVPHPSRHVWYHSSLRPSHCSIDRK